MGLNISYVIARAWKNNVNIAAFAMPPPFSNPQVVAKDYVRYQQKEQPRECSSRCDAHSFYNDELPQLPARKLSDANREAAGTLLAAFLPSST